MCDLFDCEALGVKVCAPLPCVFCNPVCFIVLRDDPSRISLGGAAGKSYSPATVENVFTYCSVTLKYSSGVTTLGPPK